MRSLRELRHLDLQFCTLWVSKETKMFLVFYVVGLLFPMRNGEKLDAECNFFLLAPMHRAALVRFCVKLNQDFTMHCKIATL